MALTVKQARNGLPETPASNGRGRPGPSADVGAIQGAAEGADGARQEVGRGVFDGSNPGPGVVDWDAGIAGGGV